MTQESDTRSVSDSVSGSVLRELLTNPIDYGYRAELPVHDNSWWKRLLSLVVISVLTMLAVWAAYDLRETRSGLESPTLHLREQVTGRLELQSLLQTDIDLLRRELDDAHRGVLPQDPAAEDSSLQLRLASSSTALTGPGIAIALDDSGATSESERLRDYDLQIIVNALWAAGAEAIDINGQRFSSSTAVRSAGSAILVNLTPLVPPYTVSAIGDPTDLQVEFARSGASSHLAVLRDSFGLKVAVDSAERLDLSAAHEIAPRFAEQLP